MELGLYCDNLKPGQLFLSMDIKGPGAAVRGAIFDVALEASPILYKALTPEFSDAGEGITRLSIAIAPADVPSFLKRAVGAKLTARVRRPYVDLVAFTRLAPSRKALLFAANHCANTP